LQIFIADLFSLRIIGFAFLQRLEYVAYYDTVNFAWLDWFFLQRRPTQTRLSAEISYANQTTGRGGFIPRVAGGHLAERNTHKTRCAINGLYESGNRERLLMLEPDRHHFGRTNYPQKIASDQ
jgi:hypothetical protein